MKRRVETDVKKIDACFVVLLRRPIVFRSFTEYFAALLKEAKATPFLLFEAKNYTLTPSCCARPAFPNLHPVLPEYTLGISN